MKEKAILHSILLDDTLTELASKIVTPADFENQVLGKLYEKILKLWKQGKPVEAGMLADDVATLSLIADLDGGTKRAKVLEEYCNAVRDAAIQRKLKQVLTSALSSGKPYFEVAREVVKSMGDFEPTGNQSGDWLVSAARFCATMPAEIEWMIEGIIPRGSNGIIAGEPKASKSWIADEISLSLASGTPFLGESSFRVPRPVKTALIAREDYPGLTSWRLRALFESRNWTDPNFFDRNLFINTRAQSAGFSIQNPQDFEQAARFLKRHKIEFAIFDVLNILHDADENDNTEMRKVMNRFSELQAAVGCSIALVHHLGKMDGKWTRRLRGASAIHGWVEWLIGVSEIDEETKVRKMEFELKASEAPKPIYYQIESEKGTNIAQIRVCENPDRVRGKSKWQ